jgi:hypothetical protein
LRIMISMVISHYSWNLVFIGLIALMILHRDSLIKSTLIRCRMSCTETNGMKNSRMHPIVQAKLVPKTLGVVNSVTKMSPHLGDTITLTSILLMSKLE